MKRQILLGLSLLVMTEFVFAEGVAEGTGQTESAACRSAKDKIPSTEKASGGCFCNEPVYEGGLWNCRVTYQNRSYSGGNSSSYSNPTPSYNSLGRFTPTPVPQRRNPYILSGQR